MLLHQATKQAIIVYRTTQVMHVWYVQARRPRRSETVRMSCAWQVHAQLHGAMTHDGDLFAFFLTAVGQHMICWSAHDAGQQLSCRPAVSSRLQPQTCMVSIIFSTSGCVATCMHQAGCLSTDCGHNIE